MVLAIISTYMKILHLYLRRAWIRFAVGQVVSNEPGYYLERQFGMRIENLIYVNKIKKKLLFEDLTLVPYDKNLINKNLLSKVEIGYLK